MSVRVSGECMAPLLESGAMIQVVRRRYYWPGDPVVVHAPDGRLLVHRLPCCYSKGQGWRWLTQADHALRPAVAVLAERIIGKVCGGDCSERLVRVPLAHRVRAVLHILPAGFDPYEHLVPIPQFGGAGNRRSRWPLSRRPAVVGAAPAVGRLIGTGERAKGACSAGGWWLMSSS